jgi:hypothetical protein
MVFSEDENRKEEDEGEDQNNPDGRRERESQTSSQGKPSIPGPLDKGNK